MTLKKYVIVYFIILSLTVVSAQESNPLPSSTTSSSTPSTTLTPPSGENNPEDCLKINACKSANETLALCDGAIKPPTKYIEEGVQHGTYRPDDPTLSKCMCNQPYYDTLSACIGCFVNATETEFEVAPLEQYKDECKKIGTTFTQTIPPPQPKGIPRKLKLGLIAGIAAIVIGLLGIGLLKYFRKKRRIAEQSEFAKRYSTELHEGGNRLTGSLTAAYPPPSSPSIHYPPPPPPPTSSDTYQPYVPPTDYPPPSNISNIPNPQSTTPYYPPPGGEYPPPHPPPPRGGQGGQSDSYYDGNF